MPPEPGVAEINMGSQKLIDYAHKLAKLIDCELDTEHGPVWERVCDSYGPGWLLNTDAGQLRFGSHEDDDYVTLGIGLTRDPVTAMTVAIDHWSNKK